MVAAVTVVLIGVTSPAVIIITLGTRRKHFIGIVMVTPTPTHSQCAYTAGVHRVAKKAAAVLWRECVGSDGGDGGDGGGGGEGKGEEGQLHA